MFWLDLSHTKSIKLLFHNNYLSISQGKDSGNSSILTFLLFLVILDLYISLRHTTYLYAAIPGLLTYGPLKLRLTVRYDPFETPLRRLK